LPAHENPFLFDDDGPRWPASKPKDAASLILVRRHKRTIRVLMGERHRKHAFLPGRFVFPGGRLDIGDLRLVIPTDLRPEIRSKGAVGSSLGRARGLALAAVRETFEETGHLVGERKIARPGTRSPVWRRFFSHGVIPKLETLDFVARAITPPGRPRRFDARFFLADAEHIALELDGRHASGELLKPVWLTLRESRAAEILPITSCILDEVEARLADGPDSERPVPFYIPRRGRAVIVSL
jgi:8-oxo-dGTP pyrophosphatase MutT (NUDIX family)